MAKTLPPLSTRLSRFVVVYFAVVAVVVYLEFGNLVVVVVVDAHCCCLCSRCLLSYCSYTKNSANWILSVETTGSTNRNSQRTVSRSKPTKRLPSDLFCCLFYCLFICTCLNIACVHVVVDRYVIYIQVLHFIVVVVYVYLFTDGFR